MVQFVSEQSLRSDGFQPSPSPSLCALTTIATNEGSVIEGPESDDVIESVVAYVSA